ncbi:hypothetical protein EDC04DRAFT_2604340 [Pisolithus marmoratus]|nr:hypothetical protein EDC04DRAFT_2604340 [Pisolithus marmoratus]
MALLVFPDAQTETKLCPSSVHNSNEVKEIPSIVRKSSHFNPELQVVDSEDDSIDIGDSEYNPDDKVSNNDGSNTEGMSIGDEDSVSEDDRQSSSHKCKHTLDDTGHPPKRPANNPKPVRPPPISPISMLSKSKGVSIGDEDSVLEDNRQSSSCKCKHTLDDARCAPKSPANNPKPVGPLPISPVSMLSKSKGKNLDITASRAVGYEDDMLVGEGQASHGSRSIFDDAWCTSERLAISPMPVDPSPVYPNTSSSKDKGSSQCITTNKTTDVSCHDQLGHNTSKVNQSHSHTISTTLVTSPDDAQTFKSWMFSEPPKDSPSITHTSKNSQVAAPPPVTPYSSL